MSDAPPITLDTPNYRLRTLRPDDACESWTRWLLDPDAARNLNTTPRVMSIEQIRAYIARFDSRTNFLFGIFDKETDALVGIRSVYVDRERRSFVDNILIGEVSARGKSARRESSDAMWRYLFEDLDLTCCRCAILAENEHMLAVVKQRGFVHEHTSHRPSATGTGQLELRHFRLDRDTWRQKQKEQAAARASP